MHPTATNSGRRGTSAACAITLAGFALLANPSWAAAQCGCGPDDDDHEPGWILSARAGATEWGSFLEERTAAGQRELTAGWGVGFGGTIGYSPWDDTVLEGNVSWTKSTLEFEDDTPGGGGSALVVDDAGEIRALVFSLQVRRYLFDDDDAFAPYTLVGVAGGTWSLDRVEAGLESRDESPFRLGGVGGLGADIRITDAVNLQLQFGTFSIGSPFDGDDGFQSTEGEIIDEREKIGVREFTAGLSFHF